VVKCSDVVALEAWGQLSWDYKFISLVSWYWRNTIWLPLTVCVCLFDCVSMCLCGVALAVGMDRSTCAKERRRSSTNALRVRQPGVSPRVPATRGSDTGRTGNQPIPAAHQSAHASRPVAARPSLQAHGGLYTPCSICPFSFCICLAQLWTYGASKVVWQLCSNFHYSCALHCIVLLCCNSLHCRARCRDSKKTNFQLIRWEAFPLQLRIVLHYIAFKIETQIVFICGICSIYAAYMRRIFFHIFCLQKFRIF